VARRQWLSNKRLLLSRVAGQAAGHSPNSSRPLLGGGPCSRIARRETVNLIA